MQNHDALLLTVRSILEHPEYYGNELCNLATKYLTTVLLAACN